MPNGKKLDGPKDRRKALAALLEQKSLDVAIISNPKHIFYFSGFPSNLDMYLTLMKGPRSIAFLTVDRNAQSSILIGQSELGNPWVKTKQDKNPLEKVFDGSISTYVDYDPREKMISYGDTISKEFEKWFKGLNSGKRVGIEDWHFADVYRAAISSTSGLTFSGISKSLLSMRKIKGKDEIENLKSATEMIVSAYKVAQNSSRSGKTELDVYRKVNSRSFEKYGPFGWIIGDYASGERALAVGGWASDRELNSGDTIVMDLQAAHQNYWSDLCRTFVVGKKPAKKQLKAQETLDKALEKAEGVMKPGAKGSEIYEAVNSQITKDGYPSLPHHAGHSVGLDDQEPPWFVPKCDEVIEEGSVCVVEPGIYTESTGGIRIEDAYVITKNGNEKISKYPRGLT